MVTIERPTARGLHGGTGTDTLLRLIREAVQIRCTKDNGCTDHKVARDDKVKEIGGRNGRDENRDGCRKRLHDVVCVRDAHGDNQAAGSLCHDGGPHHVIVPVKEAVCRDTGAIFPQDAEEQGGKEGEEGELEVECPQRVFGSLQDLFKVYAREA